MDRKFILTLVIVIGAVIFVPIIPNDTPLLCQGDNVSCDEGTGYISVYTKYFK